VQLIGDKVGVLFLGTSLAAWRSTCDTHQLYVPYTLSEETFFCSEFYFVASKLLHLRTAVLHLEDSFVSCSDLDTLENRSEIP